MERALSITHRVSLPALLALAGLLGGCHKPPAAALPAHTRRIRLAKPVSYAYLDLKKGVRPADSLEHIPLAQRGATIVHGPGINAGPGHFYVADLLDAAPGASVQAQRMTRRQQFQRARAADLGHWKARMVRLVAGELAKINPHSQRRASSLRSRKLLDQIIPPDVEEKALEQQGFQ